MANEGYLIGYEDAQGNFVQIGQFNNAADDVTKPLVLRHTNSGETLELDGSSFRPSTQIGDTNNRPDVFANTVDLNTLVGAGLDTKADLTQSDGVLVSSQLPDLAITNIDVVADQTARLALDAEEGDVAVQTDVSQTFILATNDPTVNSNWKKVQLDVLGAIDGQTITPAQTGTSSNRPDVFADTVDANQLTGVSTGGVYQEDSNSPFQANGSDIDAQLSQSYDHVIGLISSTLTGRVGTNNCGLSVNGGNNTHDYIDHSGTGHQGTSINLGRLQSVAGRFTLTRRQRGSLAFSSQLGMQTNINFHAEYGKVEEPDISSIQLFDLSNNSNDIELQLRVFFA